MLYIESPAGVGYSIAKTEADLIQNDHSSSQDALEAMHKFYEKFPDLIDNDLYISGESYAGIYVPYLSWQIYNYNQEAIIKEKQQINLKGMMVGNGATDYDYDVW